MFSSFMSIRVSILLDPVLPPSFQSLLHTRLLQCATPSMESQSGTKNYLIPCSITASIPPHRTHRSSLGS